MPRSLVVGPDAVQARAARTRRSAGDHEAVTRVLRRRHRRSATRDHRAREPPLAPEHELLRRAEGELGADDGRRVGVVDSDAVEEVDRDGDLGRRTGSGNRPFSNVTGRSLMRDRSTPTTESKIGPPSRRARHARIAGGRIAIGVAMTGTTEPTSGKRGDLPRRASSMQLAALRVVDCHCRARSGSARRRRP